MAIEPGIERQIADAIQNHSVEAAVKLIAAMLDPFRAEIQSLVDGRNKVGDALLKNGHTWHVGSEAADLAQAFEDLKAKAAPTVVVTVENGHASVRGASGPVTVVIADMDRDEDIMPALVDRILEGEAHSGSPEALAAALAEAREGLERFVAGGPRP